MGLWDFVKDAGKSIFGSEAEAAEAQPQPKAAEKPAAPAPSTAAAPAAPKPAHDAETTRKVEALKAELKRLGLDSGDVHLTLRGDTVKIESKGADRETMEKLIVAVGNIKGIARVEADLPKAPAPAATPAAAPAQPAAKAPAGDAPVFHTVKKGDTLSAIAKKYLGDANAYRKVFEANRPMLSDPDEIYPGQVLRIPGA